MASLSMRLFAIIGLLTVAGACGSSAKPGGTDAAADHAGTGGGGGGVTGAGGGGGGGGGGASGTGGVSGAGGASSGTGGTGGSDAGTVRPDGGTQPIGAACANTGNCSQADGTAVCCLAISTCVLDTQCPGGTNYVPCSNTQPCTKAGWVCCNAGGMQFCTKQSACP